MTWQKRLLVGALVWVLFILVCVATAGCAVHPGTDAAGNRVILLGNPSCVAFCVITLDRGP